MPDYVFQKIKLKSAAFLLALKQPEIIPLSVPLEKIYKTSKTNKVTTSNVKQEPKATLLIKNTLGISPANSTSSFPEAVSSSIAQPIETLYANINLAGDQKIPQINEENSRKLQGGIYEECVKPNSKVLHAFIGWSSKEVKDWLKEKDIPLLQESYRI